MDAVRKIAILIVMIVPTFVGAGAVWSLVESWIAVLIWIAVMAFVAVRVVTGKFPTPQGSGTSNTQSGPHSGHEGHSGAADMRSVSGEAA